MTDAAAIAGFSAEVGQGWQHGGSGQDSPTGGLWTDFGAPCSAVHFKIQGLLGSSSACAVCPGLGWLWALTAPRSTPDTGYLQPTIWGIFSTLDSVSPPRDLFKRCLERGVLGLPMGCSQQRGATDPMVCM